MLEARTGVVQATLVLAALSVPDATSAADAASAAPAHGASGRIVYQLRGDLFSLEPNGTGRRRLTRSRRAFEAAPSVSPDGRLIAYQRGISRRGGARARPATNAIWVMRANGTHQIRLTGKAREHGTLRHSSSSPSFSPDGRRIAYEATEWYRQFRGSYVVRGGKVWLMRADGRHKAQLSGRGYADSPAFTPDGRVAFHDHRRAGCICAIDTDGRHQRPLPGLVQRDFSLAFSPDGEWTVFANLTRGNPRCSHLYSIRAGGGDRTQITDGDRCDQDPTFSPDGSRIAFTRSARHGSPCAEDGDIYMIGADGADPGRLTSGCAPDWGRR